MTSLCIVLYGSVWFFSGQFFSCLVGAVYLVMSKVKQKTCQSLPIDKNKTYRYGH